MTTLSQAVPMGRQETCLASIVVPTYREAENLPELLHRIHQAMQPLGGGYEVIVVDDDSRDGTDEAVSASAEQGVPVRLITRTEQRGLSTAVLRGFREARGDVLVCMDADLSHPPEALPNLIQPVTEDGLDFVLGSRYVTGAGTDDDWGLYRWLNSKVATLLARPFTSVKDPMSGYFAIPRRVFERCEALDPIGYKIGLEVLVKGKCKTTREIPIHFADRKHGESKLNLKEQLHYVLHLKKLADFKFGLLSQAAQFCAVGSTGMVVDLLLYVALLTALPIGVARAAAIFVAMTWNFLLNRMITFAGARPSRVLPQYARFVGSCSAGAAVNWAVSVGLPLYVVMFQDRLLAAAALGVMAGTGGNFLLSRYWVFPKQTPQERSELVFISWAPYCSRSDSLAHRLGGRSYLVYSPAWGSRYATILIKYLVQAVRTLAILSRRRPKVVFVMAPPVVACAAVWLYATLAGARFVIDAHTAAFLNKRWQRVMFLQRFFSRRAATTIVTNRHLQQIVESWGAEATIVTDVPVCFAQPEPVRLDGTCKMTLVSSFCDDEPIELFLEAAARTPDVTYYVTGNHEKLDPKIIEHSPANVRWTGFLSDAQYVGQLLASDAVIALTARDHTMQRAAYEAVYLGRPVITSNFAVLRESFAKGAVHVNADVDDIARGVRAMQDNLADHTAAAAELRQEKLDRWQQTAALMKERLKLKDADS